MFFLRFDVKIGSIDGVEVFEFVRPYPLDILKKEFRDKIKRFL